MIFNDPVIFNAPIRINMGIEKNAVKFISSDTTPSVAFNDVFVSNSNGTVTQFDNGSEGQSISILGDGVTVISHNSNIKTNTGANKTLTAATIYRFTRINSIWYEDK